MICDKDNHLNTDIKNKTICDVSDSLGNNVNKPLTAIVTGDSRSSQGDSVSKKYWIKGMFKNKNFCRGNPLPYTQQY